MTWVWVWWQLISNKWKLILQWTFSELACGWFLWAIEVVVYSVASWSLLWFICIYAVHGISICHHSWSTYDWGLFAPILHMKLFKFSFNLSIFAQNATCNPCIVLWQDLPRRASVETVLLHIKALSNWDLKFQNQDAWMFSWWLLNNSV